MSSAAPSPLRYVGWIVAAAASIVAVVAITLLLTERGGSVSAPPATTSAPPTSAPSPTSLQTTAPAATTPQTTVASQRDLDLEFLLDATAAMEITMSEFRGGLPAVRLEAEAEWQVMLQGERDYIAWVASNPPCDEPEPFVPTNTAKMIIAAYAAPYREALKLDRRVATQIHREIDSDDAELKAAHLAFTEQFAKTQDVINAADDKYDDLRSDVDAQRIRRLMLCDG